MTINALAIPFPDFKFNETINPEEFDSNNAVILAKVNEVIALLNNVDTTTGSTMITSSTGSVKVSVNDTSKSILEEIVQAGQGFHTFYAVGGSRDLPSSGVSIRGFAHMTSATIGYVVALDYRNNLYTNYYDANASVWLGWSGTFKVLAPTSIVNSWVNYGGSDPVVQYTKSGNLIVLKGIVKNGTITPGTVIFTLPVGYRPLERTYANGICSGNVPVRFTIDTNGAVSVYSTNFNNTWVQFDGITFIGA